jgi:ligand-binding SRPBCC domain-containing protein
MSRIYLEISIEAEIEKVFYCARDIDLHQKSTAKTHEKAIAGKISGLIELHETVTWRARHLKHQHIFRQKSNHTIMTDIFEFESPAGIIGRLFNLVFLKNYMKNLLSERNEIIKKAAEDSES